MPDSKSSLLQQARSRVGALWRTVALVAQAAPGSTGLWLLLQVGQGLVPAGVALLTRPLVDQLAATLGPAIRFEQAQPLLWLAIAIGALLLAGELMRVLAEWVRAGVNERIGDYVTDLVQQQSARVDLGFYDSPDYYDSLHRARDNARQLPLALIDQIADLVESGVALLAMGAIVFTYAPWLPLLLVVGVLPSLLVVVRHGRRYHAWWERSTAARRLAQYYDTLLAEEDAAAELRLFGLGNHFRAAYARLRLRLRVERLGLLRSQHVARLGASSLAMFSTAGAMAWMGARLLGGLASLGDLVLFFQAFQQGQTLVRALLGNLGQMFTNALFLANLHCFLDLQPLVQNAPTPLPFPQTLRDGIRLRNVTFRYPGSAAAILQQFDLHIPAGKLVAIVGPNGGGKTTLSKLLCRLYDPELGSVEIDGVDIRHYDLDELRQAISVLFQLPVPYQAKVAEAIGLGDIRTIADRAAIVEAARAAGADRLIAQLPQGYDTQLGRSFTAGVELSGGEWQRVALARAFLRRAPIVILDEPTSFMDPWAEAAWLDRLRELVAGRTALVITHRFTTAMRADIIYVIEHGAIVEAGSHEELLAQGEVYARSWHSQYRVAESRIDT